MKTIKLRAPYNYDTDAASNESGLACEEPSLAQQHYKDECDINTILERFNITGLLPESPLSPKYGDFSGITDYHSALNAVIAAQDQFDGLPAQIRARFENEPAKLIEFLEDENNRPEAEQLGLVEKATSADVAQSTVTPLDVTVLGDTNTTKTQ
jgi:phage internal scaffolding protein